MKQQARIILASGSPRRKELMEAAGLSIDVCVSDVDESLLCKDPFLLPGFLSKRKTQHVASTLNDSSLAIVGADTVVIANGLVLNKPTHRDDSIRMLNLLSGKTHDVVTSFCLIYKGQEYEESNGTKVTFRTLRPIEIENYVSSGECDDKAGSYAIQGGAAHFVEHIHGSYSNVVGLPMSQLMMALNRMKVIE